MAPEDSAAALESDPAPRFVIVFRQHVGLLSQGLQAQDPGAANGTWRSGSVLPPGVRNPDVSNKIN